MFELILHLVIFPTVFLVAYNSRNRRTDNKVSSKKGDLKGRAPRSLAITLLALGRLALAKLRAAQMAIQRVEMKALSFAFMFTGKTYISEILMSATISVAFMLFRRMGLAHLGFASKLPPD